MFKKMMSLKESVEQRLFFLFRSKMEAKIIKTVKKIFFHGLSATILFYSLINPTLAAKLYTNSTQLTFFGCLAISICFANTIFILADLITFIKHRSILKQVKNFEDVYNNDHELLVNLNLSLTEVETKSLLSDNFNSLQTRYLFNYFIRQDEQLEYYDLKELDSLHMNEEDIDKLSHKRINKKSKKIIKQKELYLERLNSLFEDHQTNPNFNKLINMIELNQKNQEQKLSDEKFQLKLIETECSFNESSIKTLL